MPLFRATPAAAIAVVALLATLPDGSATAAPGPAGKPRPARSIEASPLLWATINVCDTADHPDTVGIRGSMPGSGRRTEEMYMRIQVQYWRSSDKHWHNIGPSGDSGFIDVGSARYRARQAGRNFTVTPPRTGSFILRGAVTFEWRREGEVVRRSRERTRSGHVRTKGADPADFSAATCAVRQ